MKRIYRYVIEVKDSQIIKMPSRAWILSAAYKHGDGEISLWAMVDPSAKSVTREIRIVGTGSPVEIGGDWSYVATCQQPGSPYVWHVFAIDEATP